MDDVYVFLAGMFVISLLFGLYVARIAELERRRKEKGDD